MAKYFAKRVLYMIFVFCILSVLLFFLFNMIPGDPVAMELQAIKETITPEQYQQRYTQLRSQMGLDDPLIIRYFRWFANMIRGDFGTSHVYKQPVADVVKVPLRNTIFINLFVVAICLAITIPLGIFCAVRKNSLFDKFVQVFTIIGYSLPKFIIALLAIYFFAVKNNWFPVSGMNTPGFQGTGMELFKDTMYHLFLPIMVIVIGSLGGITRYVRAAMIDALSMDYIKTARAKGLKEKVVIFSHAWRNALLPVITLIISWFMSIFSGSLITERMFNLHGMGKFYMDALNRQDFNVAIAIQMFYIIIALLGNLITDLSYGVVDPRVRVNS
ncbi:MAG: ABC transporter permease [Tissierellaceae bacterium]|nr:ABC transporter permease [Tissierellaceae bacterium]